MTTISQHRPPTVPAPDQPPRRNYLNNGYSVRSWLLTTDHKRIAVLYLLSVTFFFMIGGLAASVVRLDLTAALRGRCQRTGGRDREDENRESVNRLPSVSAHALLESMRRAV